MVAMATHRLRDEGRERKWSEVMKYLILRIQKTKKPGTRTWLSLMQF
jgi:hypothetical protein